MRAEASQSNGAGLRGMVVVAATYFAFLLFAQFALVEILRGALGGQAPVQQTMAIMGLVGLATSLWAGHLLARHSPRKMMIAGFVLSAVSSLIAGSWTSAPALMTAAALVGMGIALLTVAVATDLPRLIPGPGRGLRVGVATGVAYFLCNLPPLFNAEPSSQALVVAAVCAVAAVTVPRRRAEAEVPVVRTVAGSRWPFVAVLASFLALVWLDSAAFNVIQETVELKGLTWGDPTQLLWLGLTHLLAAVLAGALIDRQRMQSLLLAAFTLFVVSFTLLQSGLGPLAVTGPLYAIGISFYSVSLVTCPSASRGVLPARWRAALLYGVAGWVGSALGVGMAQDLHAIPTLFVFVAGTAVVAGWLVARWRSVLRVVSGMTPTLLWALGALFVTLTVTGSSIGSLPSAASTDALARGRAVYVSEGCINCHSQFVRPGTRDEDLWGPVRDLGHDEDPPLIGMRRQGPDLLNVGNRRSAEWHRMHLKNPQTLSPGSRMPSYAHLFETGSAGEDLVDYLSSLGAETARDRFAYSQVAEMPKPLEEGRAEVGEHLFVRHCQVCHGKEGRGDGPLGLSLARPAMNLQKGSFWLVPWGAGNGSKAEGLARVIKFGVPGTSMPGHEYFSDREISDLAAFVTELLELGRSDVPRIAGLELPADEADLR